MILAEKMNAQGVAGTTSLTRPRPLKQFGLLLVTLLVIGCSSAPLEPPPQSFNLSGDWQIDAAVSTTPMSTPPESFRPRPGDLVARFLAQDFPILFTERMQIEQNRDSMGIDFGQGPYRDISWGERDRGPWRVQAGWSEGVLYVFSKTHDASSREAYRLTPDGQRLTIDVEVESSGQRQSFTRVFTRRSPI